MKYAVEALTALKISVVAIPDFDIMDDSAKLKYLIKAFGLDWDPISDDMNKVFDCINADGGKLRSLIKKNGSTILNGEAPAAFQRLDSKFRSVGLFIVPIGEMECFDKTINKDKKDWVYEILERGNLDSEEELEAARKFTKAILEYKPQMRHKTVKNDS